MSIRKENLKEVIDNACQTYKEQAELSVISLSNIKQILETVAPDDKIKEARRLFNLNCEEMMDNISQLMYLYIDEDDE